MPIPSAPQPIVPEKGIDIPKARHDKLTQSANALLQQINTLRAELGAALQASIPDVEIYYNAVHYALVQDIFYDETDIQVAETLLAQGTERATQLLQGQSPWTQATGLVVRGYCSKLDGSAQPYGLVVPDSFAPTGNTKHRLDVWHHGRNNKLSELRFINDRQTNPGQFTPQDTFVLHTYGRFCNAMKFAGEVDTFEALEHAKANYPIDDNRITVRGFSMGGAATWHQAVHHASLWAAATPGAGFAETAVYQNVFAKDPKPTAWEQKLWNLYDATACASNLHQCPTIAYSGENDKQMQAANMMAEYMKKEGLDLVHIIGPGVEHKYHPDSKIEIENQVTKIVLQGRNQSPDKIRFTTYTLRYNRMAWITIDGLTKHWERARVNADRIDEHTLTIQTENVTAFTIDTAHCPIDATQNLALTINGQALSIAPTEKIHLSKAENGWMSIARQDHHTPCKIHGLQGPIDDAFMDSFIMVTPTGKPAQSQAVTNWIASEQENAIYQWTMQFRGQPRTKTDIRISDQDIQNHSLILWGDLASNAILNKIAPQLPIQWTADKITVGHQTFTTDNHVPVFIYPNPLNPTRYIVLNTGFTFAANGASSNAGQTPKLPDWAILDLTVPFLDRIPRGVVAANFFDENWALV